jgi:hypothetical protein
MHHTGLRRLGGAGGLALARAADEEDRQGQEQAGEAGTLMLRSHCYTRQLGVHEEIGKRNYHRSG